MKKLLFIPLLFLIGCAPLFIYEYQYTHDSKPFKEIAQLEKQGWEVVGKEGGAVWTVTEQFEDGTVKSEPAYYNFRLRRVTLHNHEH
ncbi:hypothetical protein LCGC14_1217550 [marine sediment metagenome]|uniref:Lipoprotein n=1 Tax=marine sediment metagenome TaxID=412755 RepID=A0A0F9LZJ1_9ZZZZ